MAAWGFSCQWGDRRSAGPPAGPEKICLDVRKLPLRQFFFRFLGSNKNSIFTTKIAKFRCHGPTFLVHVNGFVSNSFCDLTTRIESHSQEKHTQKKIGANEFTDIEKFVIEHRSAPKTIHASISAQRPGTGITLRRTALRIMCSGGPALSRATGRAGKMSLSARKRPLRPIFSIVELQRKFNFWPQKFRNFGVMDRRP